MSTKDHKIACDPCSTLQNQVLMEWLFEAPGLDGYITQVYACPSCGGRQGVQSVPDELAEAGPVETDQILPQTWDEGEELEVERQEVELEATPEVEAFDYRATLLGGDRGPAGPPVGFEVYYTRAFELYEGALKKSQSGDHQGAFQNYSQALGSFKTFTRIAPKDDHRLAAAQQVIQQLEHAGIS
jgi:hypothetical protein